MHYASDGGDAVLPDRSAIGEIAMKSILGTLIVLSVLAGIAAPASAFDARGFYQQQERWSH